MPINDPAARVIYQKIFFKAHYEKNKEYYLRKNDRRRKEARNLVSEFKSQFGCSMCPETDQACLDFHHTDPLNKTVSIANMFRMGWGPQKMIAELKKCIVMCSNCHRKLHRDQNILERAEGEG